MPAHLSQEQKSCLEGCRSYEQYEIMRKRFEAGVCPFCEIDTTLNHIICENTSWIMWSNPFVRDGLATQLVVISRRHIRNPWDLTKKEWEDFSTLLGTTTAQFKLPGGMLFARFGDMRLNAGTVPHFHWNIFVPNETGDIRIPIYKKDAEKKSEHAKEFSDRYERKYLPR